MPSTTNDERTWRAVAELYHAFFTGIVLASSSRLGGQRAADLVFEVFSRQREQKFVAGLQKLGLAGQPDAVAAAKYHYLSNWIGGVNVEFMPESDRKAWIRYGTPRWVWEGSALCGVPPIVSEAMLRGWHARNGVALGNPRLGFVCTKQAADGDSALEGYYFEYDEPLEPHQRLRFDRTQDAPDFDPALAPALPTEQWPSERLAKAHRNYAMTYPQTAVGTAIDLWGEEQAVAVIGLAAKQIGMQYYPTVCAILGATPDGSAHSAADILAALLSGHGTSASVERAAAGATVTQEAPVFVGPGAHPAVDRIWGRLFEGALATHNHRLRLERDGLTWRIH
ncbi:hypothetical protein [Cumulibacter manganitolerans]|uniref:hypothetical protein n=1 Tax=Cumulibacter manganitolerans TaxID=1884992 RepID=UPI001294A068|nr:hypothetical protein [Cumulibacter manganitolerans]